jgi:ribosome-binding factor A
MELRDSFQRDQRIVGEIARAAGEWISRESNRTSLVTVTRVDLSDDGAHATIMISVLPENQETAAHSFIKRNLGEVRRYLGETSKIGKLPTLHVEIDRGEKNRAAVEAIV